MDICKFFREGYCRNGSRCRFLHQSNYSYGYSDNYGKYYGDEYNSKSRHQKAFSGGSGNNSNYSYRNDGNEQRYKGGTNNSSANQNAYDLWNLIEKEIKILEEGHQWALTCFSVSREYGNVPGWEDHSPEELRYKMYTAIKDGHLEQCKGSISQLYKIAEERRNDFKSRARGLPIVEALIQNKDRQENHSASNQEQNTNLWQNRVGNEQSAGIFGGNSNASQQALIQPSVFGNSQFNSATESFSFSLTKEQQQQHQAQLNAPANSFMSAGNTAPSPLFQQSVQQAGSPFQIEQIAPPMQATQNNSAFFQPMPQQLPGMPQTLPASPFNQSATSSQSSVFKTNLDLVSQNDLLNYSQRSDLAEPEMAIFQAKTFKFGQVPLKPPLKELC